MSNYRPYFKIAQAASDSIKAATGKTVSPEILYAQLRLETGNFSSPLGSKYHNYGGMSTSEDTGVPRPAEEGGYYKTYGSDEDFGRDWANTIIAYVKGSPSDNISADEYVHLLSDGDAKYFTSSPEDYYNSIVSLMGYSPMTQPFSNGTGAFGSTHDMVQQEVVDASLSDRFQNQFWDSGTWGTMRTLWHNVEQAESISDFPLLNDYTPSEEDVKFVQDALKGDITAQTFVLENASSQKALMDLTRMKMEDIQRAQRVDASSISLASLGAVAGAVIDPATIASLALPGAGAAGVALKGANALKKLSLLRAGLAFGGKLYNRNKAIRYGTKAMEGAAWVGADRYLASNYAGYEANYAPSMALGAILGGLNAKWTSNAGKTINRSIIDTDSISSKLEDNVLRNAEGVPATQDFLTSITDFISKRGKKVDTTGQSPELIKLLNNNRLSILSKADATALAKMFNIELDPHAKAFSFNINNEGFSVVLDGVTDPKELSRMMVHEVGVHSGLRNLVGDENYQKILDYVSRKMKHSKSKRWRDVRRASNGDPEEALAYWAEKNVNLGNTNILGAIRKALPDSLVDSTEDELKDLVARSVKKQSDQSSMITQLSDGSYVVNGIHYSKDNAWSSLWDEMIETEENKSGDKILNRPFGLNFNKIGDTIESEGLMKNPYGILIHSGIKPVNDFCKKILTDPQKRPEGNIPDLILPAEDIKNTVSAHLTNIWIKYLNQRADYLNKSTPFFPRWMNRQMRLSELSRQTTLCCDELYGASAKSGTDWPPEIQEMAKTKMELQQAFIEEGKKTPANLGGDTKIEKGLIDEDWATDNPGFYRITDADKLTTFLTENFKTMDDAITFLSDYAKRAVRRDIMQSRYEKLIQKEKEAFEAKSKHSTGKSKDKPEFVSKYPPFEEWLDKECKDWAYGQIDRNSSNKDWFGDIKDVWNKDGKYNPFTQERMMMSQMQKRLPMDTSIETLLPSGDKFSFNSNLRAYEVEDGFCEQLINRTSGEIAWNATMGKPIPDVLDEISQALERAKPVKGEEWVKSQKDAVSRIVSRLLGTDAYALDEANKVSRYSMMLRNASYSRVGGDMSFAQLGEFSGLMAKGGLKTLAGFSRTISKIVREKRLGKETADIINQVHDKLYAEDLNLHGWDRTSSTESRMWKEYYGRKDNDRMKNTLMGSALDAINTKIRQSALITSTVSMMPKLTEAMTQEMRKSFIEDSLKWAKGEKVGSIIRNPFSDKKLKSAGINAQQAEEIKNAIKKYILDGEGDIQTWQRADPMSFYRWKKMIDYQTQSGIQQITIGNTPIFKEKYPLIFQFKDFTMRAINSQVIRGIRAHEADDAMSALYSLGTNTISYALLTEARAWAKFPDDERKRDAYLKSRLSWDKLVLNAVVRGILTGSIASFGADAYEVYTGEPMFRTTVNNTYKPFTSPNFDTPYTTGKAFDNISTRAINQAPALQTVKALGSGVVGASNLITGKGTTSDFDAFIAMLPLGSWTGTTFLSSLVKDELNLRKKG